MTIHAKTEILMPITIRALTTADEAFLWDMLYLAIYVPEDSLPISRDILNALEIAKYVKGWGRAGDSGLMALDSETMQPIGAIWLRLFSEDEPGYGYVAADIPELSIAVLPAYRGKGVGTQLMAALIERVKDAPISLSADPQNRAVALYERFGFQAVGNSGTSTTMLRSGEHTQG
jgi:ribosomal protein S18 acetylase RimI-like enzyme